MLQPLRPILISRCSVGGSAAALKRAASSSSAGQPHQSAPLASSLISSQCGWRRGAYNQIDAEDLRIFADIVGRGNVITDPAEVLAANTDWPRDCRGQGGPLLRPGTVEEVSAVLRHCQKRRLAVVPQGGNTSLAGASVPVFDELVLSLSRMNRLLEADPVSGTVVAEAGCILAQLDSQLSEHGLTVPLDLGAKGSCQIGGNLSTNAGGIRVLRYGTLRGCVRGLQAVLASGEVLDCLAPWRRGSNEDRLVQLLIGSEGTLGVLTKVALACPTKPASVRLALVSCGSFQSVLDIFAAARDTLSETLSAFEFMDSATMSAVSDNLGLRCALGIGDKNFYALVETSSSDAVGCHDADKLDQFLQRLTAIGHDASEPIDAAIANDSRQFGAIWALRERAFEALVADAGPAGGYMQFDASVSDRRDMHRLVEAARAEFHRLDCVIRIAGFGHLGDGNLHLVVTADPHAAAECRLWPRLEAFVYNWLAERRGSISAEHGLGWKRSAYLGHCKSPLAVATMSGLKNLLDPAGILNPYKVLPSAVLTKSI